MTEPTTEILQDRLPLAPWMADHTLRLPGTVPIDPADWLQRDEAFAPQMALRDRLIAERTEAVHAMTPGSGPAAAEVLLAQLATAPGYARSGGAMRRPDGITVPLDGPPLLVAGRLVQEDLCVLEKPDGADEHVLTAAVLCFPSNWTLAEKLGSGLVRIHVPVDAYDEAVARRVQRLFDCLRPEAPLMRANCIAYADPCLFNPRREAARHAPEAARYLRVERQVLMRLPETRAVVFSIHTYMVRAETLDSASRARLEAVLPGILAEA